MAVDYMDKLYAPTLKEVPAEAQIPSQQLLLRAGYIRRLASGLYSYLPLAVRVLHKIEEIVRFELDAHDAQEVQLPILGPGELWEESGRMMAYGPELMKIEDRHERTFVLGPTHEEIMCDLVRGELNSYKQLPLNLYQITDKFRDELRPRFGLMRGREFIMKDGYSFDADSSGMQKSYEAMHDAYEKIFKRIGLKTLPVAADSGQIGGSSSIEFMALAEEGEAEVLWCDCNYAADVEAATAAVDFSGCQEVSHVEKVATPHAKTIDEVAKVLAISSRNLVKAIAIISEAKGPCVLFIPGDHEVNEVKMEHVFGDWHFMTSDELKEHHLVEGFIGPLDLDKTLNLYKDQSLSDMPSWVTGANEKGFHLIGLKEGRDFDSLTNLDVISAKEDDVCPKCGKPLHFARGIEVGQIFQLGDKYSKPMQATYLDENQETHYYQMGCYGIGVSRTLQALVAESHDEAGIIWPLSVAPYAVEILNLDPSDQDIGAYIQEITSALSFAGYDVLVDNRDIRPGPKFKDAELMGIPYQITLGARNYSEGFLELTERKGLRKSKIDLALAADSLISTLDSAHETFGV